VEAESSIAVVMARNDGGVGDSPAVTSVIPRNAHWSEFPGAHPVCPSDPPEDSPVRGTLVERNAATQAGPGVPRLLIPGDQPVGQLQTSLAPVERVAPATSLRAKHQVLIAKADDRIRRRATSIVDSALRAPDLADLPEGAASGREAPKGWTKRALRIAADATNSMKSAPAYLAMAQRVVESYKKAEADKPTAPTLNAEIVQVTVNNQYNYPVRVLDED